MSEPAHTSSPPPYQRFIVGMPRAATTWMCKCLNGHPDAAAFGETTYWGRRYVEPGEDGRYDAEAMAVVLERLRKGDCLHSVLGDGPGCLQRLDRASFREQLDAAVGSLAECPTPGDVFALVCDTVAKGEGKSIAIEKTPHHLHSVDRILGQLPGSRFLIMTREPYGFMLSYKHQGDRKPEDIRRRFHRRYHPLLAALVWRSYMQRALDARRRFPDQTLIVRFEDIQADAGAVLRDVQQFFDLREVDLPATVPPDNTSFPDAERPSLRGEDRFWLHRIAGRSMRAAGYEPEPGPMETGRVLWSIIRLPWWALWNFMNMRRFLSGSVMGYVWRWLRPAGGGWSSRD